MSCTPPRSVSSCLRLQRKPSRSMSRTDEREARQRGNRPAVHVPEWLTALDRRAAFARDGEPHDPRAARGEDVGGLPVLGELPGVEGGVSRSRVVGRARELARDHLPDRVHDEHDVGIEGAHRGPPAGGPIVAAGRGVLRPERVAGQVPAEAAPLARLVEHRRLPRLVRPLHQPATERLADGVADHEHAQRTRVCEGPVKVERDRCGR